LIPMEEGTSESPGYLCDTEIDGDPYQWDARNDCEVRQILDRIAGKWSLLTIALLDGGSRRFSELQRMIDGISQRMLAVTLRQLERDGLVKRTVYAVVPPRVDYELTKLGSTLLETTHAIVAWTEEHQAEVAAARSEYDARVADGLVAAGEASA
jgi:DNA-binding HxlR family transcriptional regulator